MPTYPSIYLSFCLGGQIDVTPVVPESWEGFSTRITKITIKTWPRQNEQSPLNNNHNRSSQWLQRGLPVRRAFTRLAGSVLHAFSFSARVLCVIYTACWHPDRFGIGLSLNGSMTDSELPCLTWKQWYEKASGRREIPEALKSNVPYCFRTKNSIMGEWHTWQAWSSWTRAFL